MQNVYSDVRDTNWDSMFDKEVTANPNITYDQQFSTKLDEMISKHFPEMETKFDKYKHKKCKWMSNEILKQIEIRDKLYIKSLGINPDSSEYNKIQDELIKTVKSVRKSIRETKSNYYKLDFEKNKNDIKKTWETITDVLNKSKVHKDFPKLFYAEGIKVTGQENIAEHFNDFFVNIGPNLAANIDISGKPSYQTHLQKTRVNTFFEFQLINEEETKKAINALKPKKSSGIDNISCILLKWCGNVISKPLRPSLTNP